MSLERFIEKMEGDVDKYFVDAEKGFNRELLKQEKSFEKQSEKTVKKRKN